MAINAAAAADRISLRGGDLVGIYGFDAVVRHYLSPIRSLSSFSRISRQWPISTTGRRRQTSQLALAELIPACAGAVVICYRFVDTTTAELLSKSPQRVANRHVVCSNVEGFGTPGHR